MTMHRSFLLGAWRLLFWLPSPPRPDQARMCALAHRILVGPLARGVVVALLVRLVSAQHDSGFPISQNVPLAGAACRPAMALSKPFSWCKGPPCEKDRKEEAARTCARSLARGDRPGWGL